MLITMQNNHRVPGKQWVKWDEMQRSVFNHTYEEILSINTDILHPDTVRRRLTKAEMETIAWNAAWIAADNAKTVSK
jgi:hypothetical protein